MPKSGVLELESGAAVGRLADLVNRVGIGSDLPADSPRRSAWTRNALAYTVGLLLPGERKSMQPIGGRVPDVDYDRIQHFITNSPWDWRASQENHVRVMRDELSSPDGVVLIDDVPLEKQGSKSPGVARQYSGASGGVDNVQALVDAVYVLPGQQRNREALAWCVGMDLYLPKAWAEDPDRCEAAGIPTPVEFREKWRRGLSLLERVRRHQVPHQATVVDMGYGDGGDFRAQLREWKEPYAVAVTPTELRFVDPDVRILGVGERFPGRTQGRTFTKPHLPEDAKTWTARDAADAVARWKTIRWGEGTKGPLEGRFARRRVRVVKGFRVPTDEEAWLLLEDHPDGLKAWLCWGLDDATLEDLARLAHTRWAIETVLTQIGNSNSDSSAGPGFSSYNDAPEAARIISEA